MPILIIVALIVAGILWRLWARDRVQGELGARLDPLANRMFRRRQCQWKHVGRGHGALEEYRCESCSVTAYSQGGKPPRECKRSLRGGL
ncbi:MAG: hypothetical protein R3E44_00055 [Paracoccaceae bacterium]